MTRIPRDPQSPNLIVSINVAALADASPSPVVSQNQRELGARRAYRLPLGLM
jgi:hypothetical protein